jgi:hypothetical protein
MPQVVDILPSSKPVILGLEARHTWNGIITLNNLDSYPRFSVQTIQGLRSKADAEDNRDPSTARRGEIPRKSRRRGKTITYEGMTEARNDLDLRQAESILSAAFEDIDNEGEMVITSHPLFPDPPPPVLYRARAISCEVVEAVASPKKYTLGHERSFVLTLRLSDPRFYIAQQAGPFETGALTSDIGISLPVTAPFTIPAPGGLAGIITITNDGDADTDPIIDIYGPIINPIVENQTVGASLIFSGLEIEDGDFMRVDFKARKIMLNAINDYRSKLDRVASDWWDNDVPGFQSGDNVIKFSGENASGNSRAVVTYYHAIS